MKWEDRKHIFVTSDKCITFRFLGPVLLNSLQRSAWLRATSVICACMWRVWHVFLSTASVLYYYLYKRTAEYLGDPRLYEDSPWLRDVFARVRQWSGCLIRLRLNWSRHTVTQNTQMETFTTFNRFRKLYVAKTGLFRTMYFKSTEEIPLHSGITYF